MDKLKVLIIEDTPAESDKLRAVLQANNFEVVGVATTCKDALSLYYTANPDIAIVDIFLNGNPDGIAFAEAISAMPGAVKPFIFLTSSNDRQLFERAKLTHPFSFLLKPFNELEVLYAIEMAVEKFYGQHEVTEEETNAVVSTDYLFIKKNKSLKKVAIPDIIYIEVEERYCNVVTQQEKFVVMMSLNRIAEFLNPALFVKTHRNFIININHANEIILADNLIIMQGGHKVLLGDKYKDFLKDTVIFK
jgi:DNA-binding LytR/AlgR family response regulator